MILILLNVIYISTALTGSMRCANKIIEISFKNNVIWQHVGKCNVLI